MPDILAIKHSSRLVMAIEAKTGQGRHLYVPEDQVLRCMDMAQSFQPTFTGCVILAFRFQRITGKRKPVEYFRPVGPLAPYRMTDMGDFTYRNHAGKWCLMPAQVLPPDMTALHG